MWKHMVQCEREGDMRAKTKKATFSLHADVLLALDQATAGGMAESKNALVERALLRELRELRRQARQRAWEEGAKDTLLLKDVEDMEASFRTADAEIARRIG